MTDRLQILTGRESDIEYQHRGLLDTMLRAYMRASGFRPTARDGSDELWWGHPELGESRPFIKCVEWQLARENARHTCAGT